MEDFVLPDLLIEDVKVQTRNTAKFFSPQTKIQNS